MKNSIKRALPFIIIGIIVLISLFFPNIKEAITDDEDFVAEEPQQKKEVLISVYISGEVLRPNVYVLNDGLLLSDALKLAGLKDTSYTQNINLAQRLEDNKHYYVYSYEEYEGTINTQKININLASYAELITLEGIKEGLANKIIEYRSKVSFKDVEEIMNVAGIGKSTYDKIKDYITV